MRITGALATSAALAGIVAASDSQHRTLIDRSAATAAYVHYAGNGSPAAGWPTADAFLPFQKLWELHEAKINAECNNNELTQTAGETAQLKAAILAVDAESGYGDPAGILAHVIQESSGCVRVKSTVDPSGTFHNRGLMQSCDGDATCFEQAQCPYETIAQMIRDGVAQNAKRSDLLDAREIAKGDRNEAMTLYRAARVYNSGMMSIQPPDTGDLWRPGMLGKSCYASDYANIRAGYVGPSGCDK